MLEPFIEFETCLLLQDLNLKASGVKGKSCWGTFLPIEFLSACEEPLSSTARMC